MDEVVDVQQGGYLFQQMIIQRASYACRKIGSALPLRGAGGIQIGWRKISRHPQEH